MFSLYFVLYFTCYTVMCFILYHEYDFHNKQIKYINNLHKGMFLGAMQICIARTSCGNVSIWLGGWLGVRHTLVLYKNG